MSNNGLQLKSEKPFSDTIIKIVRGAWADARARREGRGNQPSGSPLRQRELGQPVAGHDVQELIVRRPGQGIPKGVYSDIGMWAKCLSINHLQ